MSVWFERLLVALAIDKLSDPISPQKFAYAVARKLINFSTHQAFL
jgi:hypothetical protein